MPCVDGGFEHLDIEIWCYGLCDYCERFGSCSQSIVRVSFAISCGAGAGGGDSGDVAIDAAVRPSVDCDD